jgi:O-acetyl-ADP-ribose deacetylase (regulator of RNase III)
MTLFGRTRIVLKCGDITHERCDAIVNAANSSLMGGGGVDGAIHRIGGPQIHEDCLRIVERQGSCSTGEVVVTRAGNLQAQIVIHAVGPVWQGGYRGEEELLRACYRSSLAAAARYGARTVAFPSISTGAYRFPTDRAATIAIEAIRSYVEQRADFEEIRLVLFTHADLLDYQSALDLIRAA